MASSTRPSPERASRVASHSRSAQRSRTFDGDADEQCSIGSSGDNRDSAQTSIECSRGRDDHTHMSAMRWLSRDARSGAGTWQRRVCERALDPPPTDSYWGLGGGGPSYLAELARNLLSRGMVVRRGINLPRVGFLRLSRHKRVQCSRWDHQNRAEITCEQEHASALHRSSYRRCRSWCSVIWPSSAR